LLNESKFYSFGVVKVSFEVFQVCDVNRVSIFVLEKEMILSNFDWW